MSNAPFKYCPFCATELGSRIINEIERKVCPGCDYVQWRNPVVGVAVIVMEGERILLGRRARGRYEGAWCIPCGYVEYDEDVRAAAAREFAEETGLDVELDRVYTVHSNFHNPVMHSVGIWFIARVVGGTLRADDDLSAVAYFPLDQLPPDLAFPTDRKVLDQLREDIRRDR